MDEVKQSKKVKLPDIFSELSATELHQILAEIINPMKMEQLKLIADLMVKNSSPDQKHKLLLVYKNIQKIDKVIQANV